MNCLKCQQFLDCLDFGSIKSFFYCFRQSSLVFGVENDIVVDIANKVNLTLSSEYKCNSSVVFRQQLVTVKCVSNESNCFADLNLSQ